MSYTSLLKDYLSAGTFASRPVAATLAATIPSNSAAYYFATDTGVLYILQGGGSAWAAVSGGIDLHFSGALTAPVASGFTMDNGLTATLTDLASGRGVVLKKTAAAGLYASFANHNSFSPPAAGVDFTVTGLFSYVSITSSLGFGISLKDNAGKYRSWGTRNADVGVLSWNTSTSVNTGATYVTPAAWGVPNPVWLRIARVGSNFVFSMSADGETFATVATESTTAFLASTVSKVGFMLWDNNTSAQQVLTCYSFTAV